MDPKIIYSLWTKPLKVNGGSMGFNSLDDFFQTFIFSVNVAKQHSNNIHFYTDDYGIKLLKPFKKYFPFTQVHNILNEMDWLPLQWWAFPKLYVYSLQKEPFMHLDNDAILWEKIPNNIKDKHDIVCQSFEPYSWFRQYENTIKFYQDILPQDFSNFEKYNQALNAGIYGAFNKKGLDMFYSMYILAKKTINTILSDTKLKEKIDWEDPNHPGCFGLNTVLEQAYSNIYFQNNKLKVFPITNDIHKAGEVKFTHLMGHFKRVSSNIEKIKVRNQKKLFK